jgi:glucan-binding YG repeat protein
MKDFSRKQQSQSHLVSRRRGKVFIMRYYIAASALVLGIGFGQTALAADNGMGTGENGYGYYHESNGAATGWGTQNNSYGLYHQSNAGSTRWGNVSNGNGYYHESNGSATVSRVQLH